MKERRAVLCAADAVHLLLNTFAASVPDYVQDRVCVIPNAICVPASASFSKDATSDSRLLLSVGRLNSIKQHHLLIRAMALLAGELPDWRLEIWGAGSEKKTS